MPVKRDLKDELNRCMPAAAHAKLGDLLEEIITKHNALVALTEDAEALAIKPLAERN
jgi:hypothetical protein